MDFEANSPRFKDTSALSRFFNEKLPAALRRVAAWLERRGRRTAALFVTATQEFIKDECLNLAAQISYFALFSLFPLLIGVVIILSTVTQDPGIRATILQQISAALPNPNVSIGVTEIVSSVLDQSLKFTPIFFVLFFVGLLWGGSGFFDALTSALNKAWQVPGQQRTIIESLLLRFTMFGIFLVLIVGSLGVSLTFDIVRNFARNDPRLTSLLHTTQIWDWVSVALPWVSGFVIFMILYRVVPQRRVTWLDVWPGAIVATALFELIKIGFTFYVTQVVHYNYTYGTLAGVLVFVFWLYLNAVAVLIGGEISSVHAEMRGEKRPTKLARQGQLASADPLPTTTAAAADQSLEYSYDCEEIFCVYAVPPKPREKGTRDEELGARK